MTNRISSKSGHNESDIEKLSDSAKKYITTVIEGPALGNGEFLLAVAWVTVDGCCFHQMHWVLTLFLEPTLKNSP